MGTPPTDQSSNMSRLLDFTYVIILQNIGLNTISQFSIAHNIYATTNVPKSVELDYIRVCNIALQIMVHL